MGSLERRFALRPLCLADTSIPQTASDRFKKFAGEPRHGAVISFWTAAAFSEWRPSHRHSLTARSLMPLDTHRAFKRLQEDDVFTAEQAERITETLADLDVASATKEDLNDLEGRLTERIDQVEEKLDSRFDQVNDRIDQVEERLGGRIDQLDGRINELDGRIDQLDGRVNQLDGRIDQLDGRIDQLEERFDRVDERFDRMDERMESMEERLTQQDELSEERLNRRIDEAEKRLLRWMIVGLSTVTAILGILISVVGL